LSGGINIPTYASLFRYFYIRDTRLHYADGISNSEVGTNMEVLISLGQKVGTLNALEHFRYLMESRDLAGSFQASTAVYNLQRCSTDNGSGQSSSLVGTRCQQLLVILVRLIFCILYSASQWVQKEQFS